MKARVLMGGVLLQRARKMGLKTANGIDLWSTALLKRLPTPFWDAVAELCAWWSARAVGRSGWRRASRHWCPKGKERATP